MLAFVSALPHASRKSNQPGNILEVCEASDSNRSINSCNLEDHVPFLWRHILTLKTMIGSIVTGRDSGS
eukprot:IDg7982t1